MFGRAKFDAFLKDYFDHFAFQSITTDQSLDYLRRHLFTSDPKAPMDPLVAQAAAKIPVNEWVLTGSANPRPCRGRMRLPRWTKRSPYG